MGVRAAGVPSVDADGAQLERAARLELRPCEMAIALRDGPAARFIALQGAYDTLRSRNSNM